MSASSAWQPGASVHHARFGTGRVVADVSGTVIVRFDHGIEQILPHDLKLAPSIDGALDQSRIDDQLETLVRAQALAIQSVNDQWGVFSRSRVQLLPHQLWVCSKVTRQWPTRWLIADDVGLGKTIECGLVLMPLLTSGRVRRLLILCPAKLVPQWQKRLKDMFDIRLQRYTSEADSRSGSFWDTASMVVASFHTLRGDNRGARTRLLEADRWDLVVVDEAHHFSTDERTGETQGYSLVAELQARDKIESLLFFTGTPHRGKPYQFFGLLSLVRPDLFDPEDDPASQLPRLSQAMIRNNKAEVTDLTGRRLFRPVRVHTSDYTYSVEEQAFYDTLSSFILDGRAYAQSLSGRSSTARMLLLIALQKLAASSVRAIRSALERRRAMLVEKLAGSVSDATDAPAQIVADTDGATLDDVAEQDEARPGNASFLLMKDEVVRLDELLALANAVREETKVSRLVRLMAEAMPANEPVLFFTEYKATQALVIDALHERFGHGCATFINGDEQLKGLRDSSGRLRDVRRSRDSAADEFNAGHVRFLVSTEAAGEGIDLQERCATLIHVDLPWNPMRMHQRVGRLSRYGQTREVQVHIIRNPETVEWRIWSKLNEKLQHVQNALSVVMEVQEDIGQLVVGMTSRSIFDELFSGAMGRSGDSLSTWFDEKAKTIGQQDVIEAVRSLLGNVARFDFQKVGRHLPKLDLPDLEPFLTNALSRHGRRLTHKDGAIEFISPDLWRARDYKVEDRYTGVVLDRSVRGQAAARVLGVGHPAFNAAIADALEASSRVTYLEGLPGPVMIASVVDEVTGEGGVLRRPVVGLVRKGSAVERLADWELLRLLNSVSARTGSRQAEDTPIPAPGSVRKLIESFTPALEQAAQGFTGTMRRPRAHADMMIMSAHVRE
jgi:ERCC4-related helicase